MVSGTSRYRGFPLSYGCDLGRLPSELREVFVELDADVSTRAWIDRAIDAPQSRAATLARDAAARLVGLYDANALVGAFEMRVLSTAQWRRVLHPWMARADGVLLDVGAGDGAVTSELAPLFAETITTELSAPMARRLHERGLVCHELDVALEPLPDARRFDAVALQNVLDRTAFPLRLLDRVPELLAPRGLLALAVPIPIRQALHTGPRVREPEERLPSGAAGWEEGIGLLFERALAPRGFVPRALARAPYLCRAEPPHPLRILDDAILVCAPPPR